MSGLLSAEILEALGKHEAAATLRWGHGAAEMSIVDVDDELEAWNESAHAVDELERLEKVLCRKCRTKWEAGE